MKKDTKDCQKYGLVEFWAAKKKHNIVKERSLFFKDMKFSKSWVSNLRWPKGIYIWESSTGIPGKSPERLSSLERLNRCSRRWKWITGQPNVEKLEKACKGEPNENLDGQFKSSNGRR